MTESRSTLHCRHRTGRLLKIGCRHQKYRHAKRDDIDWRIVHNIVQYHLQDFTSAARAVMSTLGKAYDRTGLSWSVSCRKVMREEASWLYRGKDEQRSGAPVKRET
jgi:hypothetical protein